VHTLEAKDIWLRDFMPVRTGPDRFVWFRYEPDYLRNRSAYRTPKAMLQPQLPWLREREADGRCQHSALNVDGGNVVGRSGRYLMVEKVLRENEGMTEPVVSQLEEALHGEVILLPQQGGDPLGHADGAVRWLDDTTVLMSDFRRVDSGYDQILLATLRERGLAVERFPYGEVADSGQGSDEQIPTATGCYLNFLEVAGHLFLPALPPPPARARALPAAVPGGRRAQLHDLGGKGSFHLKKSTKKNSNNFRGEPWH